MIAVLGHGAWLAQAGGLLVVGGYTLVVTVVLVKLVGLLTPLRVSTGVEVNGLDLELYGERA